MSARMTSATDKRNCPRFATHRPAQIEVNPPPAFPRSKRPADPVTVDVEVNDVSAFGIRIQPSALSGLLLEKSMRITFRIPIGSRTISVPGTVAWTRASGSAQRSAGIRLFVEVADIATRKLFADWVIGASRAAAAPIF